jgi:hypothetical protein
MNEEARCWLVDREYDDKGLVTVVYATPDGRRRRRFQWAASSLARRDVTAAIDVDPDTLEEVPEDRHDRYAEEAERMAAEHDPEDEL